MPDLKFLPIIISILLLSHNATCQHENTDSLITIAKSEGNTIRKVDLLLEISSGVNIDASFAFLNEALAISEKIHYMQGSINAMLQLSFFTDDREILRRRLILDLNPFNWRKHQKIRFQCLIATRHYGLLIIT